MTTHELIATMVQTLAETFRVPLSAPAARGYLLALEDLPEEKLRGAARLALMECRFMPSPAELLAFAGRKPRDLGAEATLAWDAVRRHLDKIDVYGNPDFGPVVNAVVRNLGGWSYLCEQKLSELEWRRKDFERVYRLWAEKDPALLPDGSPLMGDWPKAPVTVVKIAGLPEVPRALTEKLTPQGEDMRKTIRELAESKS